MFLGNEQYLWLIIIATLIISIPFKIKFVKWWNKRQQRQKDAGMGNGGNDE